MFLTVPGIWRYWRAESGPPTPSDPRGIIPAHSLSSFEAFATPENGAPPKSAVRGFKQCGAQEPARSLIVNGFSREQRSGDGVGSHYCLNWLIIMDELREEFRVAHEMGTKVPKLEHRQCSAQA